MKIGFVVGQTEQHEMELSFDQASGDLLVLMDGTQVLQDSSALAVEPIKSYELSIGDTERHMLALQLSFGDDLASAGLPAAPRLSLRITSPIL